MGRRLEQLFVFQSDAICRTSSTNFSIPPFSISHSLHLYTAKTFSHLSMAKTRQRSRAAPCEPFGRTSCGFPPKLSFFGASVGLAHKLSPSGVCSRIPHFSFLNCLYMPHQGLNIIPFKEQSCRTCDNFSLLITSIFSTGESLGIIGGVSGAPEGVQHTLPAEKRGQRPIMPVLAAAPLPEFAGAAVLFTTITHCRLG